MPTNLTDRLGELIGCAEGKALGFLETLELACMIVEHKDEILSALRKAEEPVSGYYAELAGRLRATKPHIKRGGGVIASHDFPINPDGPEAATAIERLTAREAELCEALKLAVKHIEHMASWIDFRGQGYNFESLGEDLPGIRARLSPGDEK